MIFRTLKQLIAGSLLVLLGCSKGASGAKMSGDLVPFVLKCAATRGASPTTNSVVTLQAEWTHQGSPLEDIIAVSGDHFDEVQAFLKQAFGEPDRALGSIPVSSVGGSSTRQGVYSGRQIGVGLNFSGDSKNTVICIIGAPKP